MNTDDMKRHALKSLRLAAGQGWTNASLMRDYATEALVGAGVVRATARDIVARVWHDNFEISDPN